jgi:hypothetical protein
VTLFANKEFLFLFFFIFNIFFTPEGTPPNPRFVFDTQSWPRLGGLWGLPDSISGLLLRQSGFAGEFLFLPPRFYCNKSYCFTVLFSGREVWKLQCRGKKASGSKWASTALSQNLKL